MLIQLHYRLRKYALKIQTSLKIPEDTEEIIKTHDPGFEGILSPLQAAVQYDLLHLQWVWKMAGMKKKKEKMTNRDVARFKAEMHALCQATIEDTFEAFAGGRENHMSDEAILATARHEAGHALINAYFGYLPTYITITSRGGYGGYTQMEFGSDGTYTKEEDRQFYIHNVTDDVQTLYVIGEIVNDCIKTRNKKRK